MSSRSDTAYLQLRGQIATCKLAPGSLLNERVAAMDLGMSRTPFRQALHRLALEGLIVTVPKKGVYVTLLDLQDLRDNMTVREALEAEVVRRICEYDLEVDFAQLKAIMDEMKRSSDTDDGVKWLAEDELFHKVIMQSVGSRRMMEAAQNAWVHLNRARYLLPPNEKPRQEAIREHRRILTTLKQKDTEAALEAMRFHLQESLSRLEDIARDLPSSFLTAADEFVPEAVSV